MSCKTTVKEYIDYSTFHGISRTKNSPYLFLKALWVLVLFGSIGMIIWQIHGLYEKYKGYPISTSVEVKTASALEFPSVVICNTSPAMYRAIPPKSNLSEIIKEASNEYSIDPDIFNTTDIYGYNYTSYDEINKDKPVDHDVLLRSAELFKMRMSVLDDEELLEMTQPKAEFILLCNFAGKECSGEAIRTLRTYHYGMCYVFDPKQHEAIKPHGEVSAVGPRYSLEVLLNIDERESVPFVTSSVGALVGIQLSDDYYFREEESSLIPIGFETNIALSQVRNQRVPGKTEKKRCKQPESDYVETLSDCRGHCSQDDIANHCGCYHFSFDVGLIKDSVRLNSTRDRNNGWRRCYTVEDYQCIQQRLTAFITNLPTSCEICLAPCHEVVYEKDISMVSWPDKKYLPILRRIIQTRLKQTDLTSIDNNFVRSNLALVRIYLTSLSYQYVKEEYTYSEVDFISDIGGQLGLWIGCSVLSIFEVVELILLLLASVRARKTSPEDKELPEKKARVKE